MRLDSLCRRFVRPGARASASSSGSNSVVELDNFLSAFRELILQMDRNAPASFAHSFAGEFDSLLRIDREAVRNANVEFYSSISPENTMKNRYPNILTNENTRIKLRDVQPGDDYVNANAITGFGSHQGYIAAQAPLPGTMAHFWQMIHEEKCKAIVMLTREQEEHCVYPKCDRYWPSPGQWILFGQYFVYGLGEQINEAAGIVERKFRVIKALHKPQSEVSEVSAAGVAATGGSRTLWSADEDGSDISLSDASFQTPVRRNTQRDVRGHRVELDEESRLKLEREGDAMEVIQIQYVDWPDQGVPDSPQTLLQICTMVDGLDMSKPGEQAPGRMLVHCSAGVGRTGTFIAVHKLLLSIYDGFPPEGLIRAHTVPVIQELVGGLKRDRSKMVQTPEQYRFIFVALAAGIEQYRNGICENAGTSRQQ